MTTAIATDQLARGLSAEVGIDNVEPHPENPRRIDDKHPSLEGLAQSILETGLINPITVQQLAEGRFRILAGERRWRAARKAGLRTIAVRVLKVTEEQAFHILTVENLQREDLHWIEEARGVEAMLKKGWDPATIAKHVGRSEQWVRLRAKLASISPKWRKVVEDPESEVSSWPAGMLELIARFPIEAQDAMLLHGGWQLTECKTVDALQDFIEEHHLRTLKAAPWNLADKQLVPKAGACSACPKRSSCQQQLFAEVKEDRCLDATCWSTKQEAHVVATVAAAKKAEPKAVLVGDSYHAPKALQRQVQSTYEFREVKEGAKGAVPAVFVTGEKAGTTGWVTKGREAPVGSRAASTDKPKEKSPKVRLAEFMKKRIRERIYAVIGKLGGDPDASPYQARYAKVKAPAEDLGRPDTETLIAFALSHGLPNDAQTRDWPAFRKFMDTDVGVLADLLWRDIRQRLVQVLGFDAQETDAHDEGAKAIADACGLNWNAITAAARDRIPLPKTLAAFFDEDGKPVSDLQARVTRATKTKATQKPKAKPAAAKA